MSEITLAEFKRCLNGFNVADCVVRDRNFLYLIARENYTEWPESRWNPEEEEAPGEYEIMKHVCVINRKKNPGEKMGRVELLEFDRLFGGVSNHPKAKFVAVSADGGVYSAGSGESGVEKALLGVSKGGPYRGAVIKLRTIDGWLYYCGGNNSVGKRLDVDQWQSFSHAIPDPKRNDHLHNSFYDIDGFNEQDIYCVGTEGQVYHFDGKLWRQLPFPSNMDLETVCCAGDGNVYIGGSRGSIFKGRAASWKLIHKGDSRLPYRDMVWYEGCVWCTSDYEVAILEKDKLRRADLPDGMSVYAGNLSAADGVLMLAGFGGAAFLENGHWTRIFSATQMNRDLLRDQKK